EVDGVAGPGRRAAPPVEHDKDHELARSDAGKAGISALVRLRQAYDARPATQIAANESGSRDAPPTRAPSTSGWTSSSAALSGFTEPPYSTGTSSSDLMNECASWAMSGVAVRPVPIAQTGS